MLYDGLLSLDLPSSEGAALSTGLLEGLERLLFTGRYHRRFSTCTLSTAVVLARCHSALRALGAERFVVESDADEALVVQIGSERWGEVPPRWAERLPPAWESEPCAFRLSASWRDEDFAYAAQLRFVPRHEAETGGLLGSLRSTWWLDQDELEERLAATLNTAALRHLHRTLDEAGSAALLGLCSALGERFSTVVHRHQRVVVLHGYREQPERFVDVLSGLPDEVLGPVERAIAKSAGAWQALEAGGVPGRLRGGVFTQVAEAADHVV